MKIVRTLVEDHKEPENKSVYWLDLNTKIVKRWADEAWVPLFEVDFPDVQNVNIVGDQIPVRDVNVLNDININGKVEIDDTKPVNVSVNNDTPIQVEVTNQMEIDTPLDVNIVSPDPLNVQFENSEENPIIVKTINEGGGEVAEEIKVNNEFELDEYGQIVKDESVPVLVTNGPDRPISFVHFYECHDEGDRVETPLPVLITNDWINEYIITYVIDNKERGSIICKHYGNSYNITRETIMRHMMPYFLQYPEWGNYDNNEFIHADIYLSTGSQYYYCIIDYAIRKEDRYCKVNFRGPYHGSITYKN